MHERMSRIGAMIMAEKSKNPKETFPNDTGPPKYLMKWFGFNPNFRGERKFARF
jgi:hypothetical protein